jgi:hypothetical protein
LCDPNLLRRAITRGRIGAAFYDGNLRASRPAPFGTCEVGERYEKLQVSPKERASGILARIAKAIAKPGADRTRVFQSASSKPVYAYSIYSKDTTK